MPFLYILIIAVSLIGFFLTVHIYRKKQKSGPLVCMAGADCETVVKSEFSSFLGIGLELYGAAYYLMVAFSYLILLIWPALGIDIVIFLLTGFTIGAFLFSAYLTFVQAFLIKSWCSWCLTSAGISTGIFALTTIGIIISDFSLVPVLVFLSKPILMMHLLGFALGVGGATISDVLFMRFLKDFRISNFESRILKIMSQVIWVGLFAVIISGVGLYLPASEALNESSKFLVKMTVVIVITINGAFLNLFIAPKLVRIHFKGDTEHHKNCLHLVKTHRLRKTAFALGAVSFISWYSAFILGTLDSVPLTYTKLLSIYLGLILVAVIGSQILEKFYCSKQSKKGTTISTKNY